MSDYDSPWKEALDVYFERFLAFFFPVAHADIDWGRGYVFLDKELQQIVRDGEVGRRTVDKLVKVWLRSGEEQWVLIHVEVQMTRECDFPLRMYVYNYRAFDVYNREVVSFAVLGDDNPGWRPDTFGYSRWGFRTQIQFPVAKLWDYVDRLEELERHPNPFAIVVLAHLRSLQTRGDERERHKSKIRLIKGLFDRGLSAEDGRKLFRLIDWLIDLPKELDTKVWNEIRQYEKEKHMPFITTPERIGMERGLAQGRLEGIELALEVKFGVAGLRLMPEIRAITDEEKLKAVIQAMRTAATPEDLRRVWAE